MGKISKSFFIWLGIIPLAFINGGIREILLIPNLGQVGLQVSALTLCSFIFLLSYIFIPRLGNSDKKTFIKMGILWAIATVVFEFLLGFLMNKSIYEILSQYNILTGNLWVMVILFTAFVPITVAKIKNIIK